jgi:hypothetical protein
MTPEEFEQRLKEIANDRNIEDDSEMTFLDIIGLAEEDFIC